MSQRPAAYEGSEDYIFVSYAHNDRERVFDVLHELEKNGYRFWYDEGIAPGTEWAEDIARHLQDSSAVMAFITETSVNSDNCRREITYALAKNKPVIGIILEKTEMSAGLELQLSAQQNVIRYNYSTYEAFINKILSSPDIELCRAAPEPEEAGPDPENDLTGPLPGAEAEATRKIDKFYTLYRKNEEFQKLLDEEYEKFKEAGSSAAVTEEPAVNTAAVSAAASAGKKQSAGAKASPGKKQAAKTSGQKGKLPVKKIILAAAVLIVILSVINSVTSVYKTTWGEKIKKSGTSLDIVLQTLQQEDIDSFARFKKLNSLSFSDCDLSQCDLSPLFSDDRIHYLRITSCTGISDYGFLTDHTPAYLTIRNTDSFSDISQLNTDKLKELDISGTAVSDLSALKNAAYLTDLDASSTQVSDISFMEYPNNLKILNISDTAVKSIDPALMSPSLINLQARNCSLDPFSKQCAALELYKLDLHNTGISDMSVFSDCTRLLSLDLSGNSGVKDLSWFNWQNGGTLKDLNISQTGLDDEDLSVLKGCLRIEDLRMDQISTDNLDFCAELTDLITIYAQGCGITDISGLENCRSVKTICLENNNISDISPLKEILGDREGDTDVSIDLAFNSIKDVSELDAGTYNDLILFGNDQNVASTIPQDTEFYNLCIDWFEGITDVWYAGSEGVTRIYISGTPQNEKLRTEEAFKHSAVNLITHTEFYDKMTSSGPYDFFNIDFSNAAEQNKDREKQAAASQTGLGTISDPIGFDLDDQ